MVVIGFSILFCNGCATSVPPQQSVVDAIPTNKNIVLKPINPQNNKSEPAFRDPNFAPIHTKDIETINPPTGSLFNPLEYHSLFSKKRQYRIGDMIFVELEEETKASKNQALARDKDSDFSLNDFQLRVGPINASTNDMDLSHDQASSFNANSKVSQSNDLEGTVNVFVRDVLANGDLVVSGEKWIKLTEGEEFLRVEGIIRVADINQETNSINSTNIGNARIEYSGTGEPTKNQQPTLIGNLLSIFN